jgi:hypothetical protein
LSWSFVFPFAAALLKLSLARHGERTFGTTDFTAAFIGAAGLALMSVGFGRTFPAMRRPKSAAAGQIGAATDH